jgi:AcrR family transcriptional regulator
VTQTAVTPLRRVPVQERSAARVERMLDACAELLDEIGYDATTTKLIAERAKVAIGSIYQFFPDKRAVVQALALRYLAAFRGQVITLFAERTFGDWTEAADAVVDCYVEMHRTQPGLKVLQVGEVIDQYLPQAAGPREGETAVQAVAGPLGTSVEVATRAVTVSLTAADAVLKLAFRRDPQGDAALVEDARRLVRGYLEQATEDT